MRLLIYALATVMGVSTVLVMDSSPVRDWSMFWYGVMVATWAKSSHS